MSTRYSQARLVTHGLELVHAGMGLVDNKCKRNHLRSYLNAFEGWARLRDATGNVIRAMIWLHLELARIPNTSVGVILGGHGSMSPAGID
jgi:hypothetical protein